jgi:type VI secretion system protein ImpA
VFILAIFAHLLWGLNMLASLLVPRSDLNPSGENLEYDSDFTALMLAAQPGEERQVGAEIVPGEDPNFPEVVDLALAVLARSHDLRAAIPLAQAQLAVGGLEGLADPVHYIRRCLEEYWDTCHPQLDPDDDNDPTMRVNAVLGLAAAPLLATLRATPLADSRTFGRVSLRDMMIADGEITAPPGTVVPDKAGIAAALKETKVDTLRSRLDAARRVSEDLAAINTVFDTRIPGLGPDLAPLMRMMRRIAGKLAEAAGEPETATPDATADTASGTASPAVSIPGAINTPEDARAALDRIITYYETHEPSSPVPIILHRARRLIGADFLSIIKDLAPYGLENVKLVGGIAD